jgi:hypothetical protein
VGFSRPPVGSFPPELTVVIGRVYSDDREPGSGGGSMVETAASEAKDRRTAGGSAGGLPNEFVEAIKDSLEHIYDFSRLNHHRLARWLIPPDLPRGVSQAQYLRQRLIEAIEHLNPGNRIAPSARQKRAFHLLQLRYVEALSFREVMRTLALSQTQYHREQRHALEMVAAYLWDTVPDRIRADVVSWPERDAQPALAATGEGSLHLPESGTRDGDDEVQLGPFLSDVVQLVERLAAERQVHVRVRLAADGVVATNRTTQRSAVISALG